MLVKNSSWKLEPEFPSSTFSLDFYPDNFELWFLSSSSILKKKLPLICKQALVTKYTVLVHRDVRGSGFGEQGQRRSYPLVQEFAFTLLEQIQGLYSTGAIWMAQDINVLCISCKEKTASCFSNIFTTCCYMFHWNHYPDLQ